MVERCAVTTGLLDALLAIASERDPASVSTLLLVSEAGDLDAARDDGASTGSDGAASAVGDGAASTDSDEATPTDDDGAAAEANPEQTVAVADLDPATPVFTDLYFPSAGRSVDAVFGVDVSVPHGQAQGRFVSHPLGELTVSKTDDLHEVVLVAVPPWTREDVAAFDRSGRRLELQVVAAAPPEQPFEG